MQYILFFGYTASLSINQEPAGSIYKHYELYRLSTKLNERLFGNKLLIINTGKE